MRTYGVGKDKKAYFERFLKDLKVFKLNFAGIGWILK
jgi:hypothetical protein